MIMVHTGVEALGTSISAHSLIIKKDKTAWGVGYTTQTGRDWGNMFAAAKNPNPKKWVKLGPFEGRWGDQDLNSSYTQLTNTHSPDTRLQT